MTTDSNDSIPSLSLDEIVCSRKNSLFAEKSWKWSNQAWQLPAEAIDFLYKLGNAGVSFFRALERLYLKSARGERILRNKDLKTPWVAEYLDAGKPRLVGKSFPIFRNARYLAAGTSPRSLANP